MRTINQCLGTALLAVVLTLPSQLVAEHWDGNSKSCDRTARLLKSACRAGNVDDFYHGRAICENISDRGDRRECKSEAREILHDSNEECRDILDARKDLCDQLGQGRYEPDFSPENFVDPDDIGGAVAANPYLPLIVGMVRVYHKTFIDEDGEEVFEEITVTTTDEIKVINGVRCRVSQDVVVANGDLLEDTDDWFAQHIDGSVWYCGEEVKDYEFFDEDEPRLPELVDVAGSFKAGRDGDLAGILMLGNPQVGDVYREEASYSNAEDASEILSINASETVPAASCTNDCVVTRAFSPLEPGIEEMKFYARDIGPILELDEEGNRTELVKIINP